MVIVQQDLYCSTEGVFVQLLISATIILTLYIYIYIYIQYIYIYIYIYI